jgi:dynein heavy chain
MIKVIKVQLVNYSENHPVMNLVLFKYTIEHVVRISKGITAPSGYMLLVGLERSGKQSLTRLASFLSIYSFFSNYAC